MGSGWLSYPVSMLGLMKVGYACVSTPAQVESLRSQSLELEAAGCERVFTDVASGARADRPGLAAAVAYLREGDTLTVTHLDRLGRTTVDTLKTVRDLDARGIRVTARDLELDTATPAGKLVVSVLASLAEWERDTLRERTQAGPAHARAQGRHGGARPHSHRTKQTPH